jgi:hypothetical protein
LEFGAFRAFQVVVPTPALAEFLSAWTRVGGRTFEVCPLVTETAEQPTQFRALTPSGIEIAYEARA